MTPNEQRGDEGYTLTLDQGIRCSEHVNELFAALAAAQGEMEHASKNEQNPEFNNKKYADLAANITAARPHLAKRGISVIQIPALDGDYVTVTTILGHSSGQYIQSELKMMVANQIPHTIGKTITYARRYAYGSIVGLAAEDDDGNAGSGKGTPEPVIQRQEKVTTMPSPAANPDFAVVAKTKAELATAQPDPQSAAVAAPAPAVTQPAVDEDAKKTIKERKLWLAKKIGVDEPAINAIIMGVFGVDKGQQLPRTTNPYFPVLEKIKFAVESPEFIAAVKADPKAAGKSLNVTVKEPPATAPMVAEEADMLASHPFAKEFGWSPEIVAIAQAYAAKRDMDVVKSVNHFKVLRLDESKPEDVAAYLTLAYHSNEMFTLKKIIEKGKDGASLSFAKGLIEKAMNAPVTINSNSAEVNKAVLNLTTELSRPS
jgi:hypothetical protein